MFNDIIRPSLKKYFNESDPNDEQILELLKPYAKKLGIAVEEVALNLHFQNIFRFDNIYGLLKIEYFKE